MACLICGKTNDNSNWNLKNDNNLSSFERHIFSSWKRECITATCQVLFDSKSEYFVDYFLNSKYCSCCEQVVRDIGFAWKQVKSFQEQIFQLSRKIYNLVDGNCNQIKEKTEANVVSNRISTLALVQNEKPDFSNYSFQEMVEIIFGLISSPKNSTDPHTHLLGSHSFISTNWIQQAGAEFKIKTGNVNRAESVHILKTEEDFDVHYCLEEELQDIYPSEGDLLTSFNEEKTIEEQDKSDIEDCEFDDIESGHSFSSNRNPSNDNITNNERDCVTENSSENNTSLGTVESKEKSNSLKCAFENCNGYFDTEYKQQTHFYLTHGFEKPYKCPGCELKFIHEVDLTYHLKKSHDESLEYNRCSFCGKLYENKEQLTFHYSNAHQEPNSFKCAFCDGFFKTREYLINHTSKFHSDSIDSNNKEDSNHSNQFQCVSCSALHKNREDLILHTKEIHSGLKEKQKYICKLCKQSFTTNGSMKEHSAKDHKHKCSLCEIKCITLPVLISHMEEQHEPNLKCDECGKTFSTLKCCLYHKEFFHTKRGHKCKTCGISLATISELRAHKCVEHEKSMDSRQTNANEPEVYEGPNSFICGFCPKNFNNYITLQNHVKLSHKNQSNGGKFKCGVCGGYYANIQCLSTHLRLRCRPSLPSCKFCGKSYINEGELNAHCSEAHQGPNPFLCAFCPEIFNNSSHLITHTKQVHPDPENSVRKFKCDVCGNYMSSSSSLQRHSLIHLDPSLVIKCNVCHIPFRDSEKLEKHIRVVHAQQQFICDTCGRTFKELRRLNSHAKIHDETLRTKQCRVCDKKFITALSRLRHEKTHTDVKDIFCDICGKGFINVGNLREHRKIHTGEPTRNRKRMS